MRRNLKRVAAVPAAALVLSVAAAPASGAPLVHERFTETSSVVVDDFCDEITARIDEVATGMFLLKRRGPDGLAYGQATVRRTLSFTNLANDKTFTFVGSFVDKDVDVIENEDGTFTVTTQTAGGSRMYGPEGNFLGTDAGITRLRVLVDENGEVLDFLGVVKGELVNACPLVLEQIG